MISRISSDIDAAPTHKPDLTLTCCTSAPETHMYISQILDPRIRASSRPAPYRDESVIHDRREAPYLQFFKHDRREGVSPTLEGADRTSTSCRLERKAVL